MNLLETETDEGVRGVDKDEVAAVLVPRDADAVAAEAQQHAQQDEGSGTRSLTLARPQAVCTEYGLVTDLHLR